MNEYLNWDDLRPEVRKFAYLMERKLREHDSEKGSDGWKKDNTSALINRVDEEIAELHSEIIEIKEDHFIGRICNFENFKNEAIDVANMSMMALDVLGKLDFPEIKK